MSAGTGSMLRAAAVVVVAVSVAAGLYTLGSPGQERARRMDARRVAELRGIRAATDLYWSRHERLPASLDELAAEPGVQISEEDPETSEGYAYAPVDSAHYEVCATFALESEQQLRSSRQYVWAHGAGRHCFRLEAEEPGRRER